MKLLDVPKIDCHCHILDPQRFPYGADIPYHPQGQEVGTMDYFAQVMDAYGVRHALLVGPNSGYGLDNRCLLDAIARGAGRFKGIAVVRPDTSIEELRSLKSGGVVGIAFNAAFHGLDYYADIDLLLSRLASQGLWAQFQVAGDQMDVLLPRILRAGVRTLVDHCGRPVLADGADAPGIRSLLALGESGQGVVKLSGFAKFSQMGYPFADTRDHVQRLWDGFGPQHCVWASDWPFLRAPYRLDMGTLLVLASQWFTPDQCLQMMWETPKNLFDW